MRGKEFQVYQNSDFIGITPAHAGKSVNQIYPLVNFKDHPRTCEEKK